MKKNIKIFLGMIMGIVVCIGFGLLVYILFFAPKTYEGNNMKFLYDRSLEITYREQENCKNITVNNEDGTMVVTSVLIQREDMDTEAFFDSNIEYMSSRKEWAEGDARKQVANDEVGREDYREYELTEIDFTEIKVLAQAQKLEDNYYLLTLAGIEREDTNFAKNEKFAKMIIDSIVYSHVEEPGDLELTEELSLLFQIENFLFMNVDMDTTLHVEDIDKEVEEHYANIPADMELKESDGYEYLMSRDIASADGNVYQIMVPKDYVAEDDMDKRFITYLDNGFAMSMYARELFAKENLKDFFETNADYECDNEFYECFNITKTEVIEKDGMLYQVAMAERYDYDGNIIPMAEVNAAIPLGGEDVLAFSLNMEISWGEYNEETIKYLEEIEQYYGVPVIQFADFVEQYDIFEWDI